MIMHTQKQEKICLGCEGTINALATFCPYCGSDASQDDSSFEDHTSGSSKSLQDMSNLSSLYKPPYTPNQKGFGVPSYQEQSLASYEELETPSYETQEPEASEKVEVGLWPLLFLSMGAHLLTLGLILFFFSDRGRLVLEWNSYYWFVYCLLATPLLMFGWKLLKNEK
jgi:hypothetical protein